MSVISPLLDTLLHQVLGRRADLDRVAARPVQQPLGAVTYTPPPRHATSDTPEEHQLAASGQSSIQRHRPMTEDLRATSYRSPVTDQNSSVSTRQHFSPEARTIASVLSRFPNSSPPVQGGAPLIAEMRPPTVGLLAHALGREIALSGLFYEAHLARWTQGRLDRQSLQREPQGSLMLSMQGAGKQNADAEVTSMRMESSSPAGGSVTSIIHQDAQALLRQQLELMASGVFRWNGDIWPDVPMEWEIEEGSQESSGENPAPWSTRLHLTMPSLGAIELRLMLTGDRLQIRGVDLSAETAQQLEQGGNALQQRLMEAGFQVPRPTFKKGGSD